MVRDLDADPRAGVVDVQGRVPPRYERRVPEAKVPARSDSSTGLPACITKGYFCLFYHMRMAKCFELLGPSRQELNSAENFTLESVAMIHVMITVTELLTTDITEREHLPESYSSQECLSQA